MIAYENGEVAIKPNSRKNPMQEERRPTDVYFLPLIAIFFIWLGIGINALSRKPVESKILQTSIADRSTNSSSLVLIEKHAENLAATSTLLTSCVKGVPAITILNLALMFLYIHYLKNRASRFFCILALVLIGLALVGSIAEILRVLFFSTTLSPFFICIYVLLQLIYAVYLIVVMRSTFEVNIDILANIVKEYCGAIVKSPIMLVFSFFINFIFILVLLFMLFVFHSLVLLSSTKPVAASIIINFIGGLYVLKFVSHFGYMVVSGGAAHSYWSSDITGISNASMVRYIKRTFRYHLGTISYASTGILPFICASCVAITTRRKFAASNENLIVKFCSRIFTVFFISEFALIQTAIYGSNFKESTEKIFNIIPGHSTLYLASSGLGKYVRNVGVVMATLFWSIVIVTLIYAYELEYDMFSVMILILAVGISTAITFHLLMDAYLNTFLIYKMTFNESLESESEIQPVEI